jgi:hypothetical protein
MHGRYKSHILFISFNICMLCTYHDIFVIFYHILILNIPYMDINRSTTPAGQSWFVHLVLLYAIYNKYFHPTSTMTHFNWELTATLDLLDVGQLKNHGKVQFFMWFSSKCSQKLLWAILLHALHIMTPVEGFPIYLWWSSGAMIFICPNLWDKTQNDFAP